MMTLVRGALADLPMPEEAKRQRAECDKGQFPSLRLGNGHGRGGTEPDIVEAGLVRGACLRQRRHLNLQIFPNKGA